MTDKHVESRGPDEQAPREQAEHIATVVAERTPGGSLLVLLGSALLARAILFQRRGRALGNALAGAVLVGFGRRKRRSGRGSSGGPDAKTGTVEERSESHRIDINPRGTEDEPDVETETGPDDGSVQFTDERTNGPDSDPSLDEPAPDDPRVEGDEEVTEVDLSEASMADEASEATGPSPEQAQPARTEATEPEPSPEEVEGVDADVGERADESGEESTGRSEDESTDEGDDEATDQDGEATADESSEETGDEHADEKRGNGDDT